MVAPSVVAGEPGSGGGPKPGLATGTGGGPGAPGQALGGAAMGGRRGAETAGGEDVRLAVGFGWRGSRARPRIGSWDRPGLRSNGDGAVPIGGGAAAVPRSSPTPAGVSAATKGRSSSGRATRSTERTRRKGGSGVSMAASWSGGSGAASSAAPLFSSPGAGESTGRTCSSPLGGDRLASGGDVCCTSVWLVARRGDELQHRGGQRRRRHPGQRRQVAQSRRRGGGRGATRASPGTGCASLGPPGAEFC